MNSKGILAAICGTVAFMAFAEGAAQAGGRVHGSGYRDYRHVEHGKPRYRKKYRTRVRGFVFRGGYYSYINQDVINTFEGSQARYGSANAFRDPYIERQTVAGPFDSGFFFDSGLGPRGGDSPYPK